ncbi:hypothetical protein ACO0K9_14155 [Undibacterium sp. Ji50W]|uniref:hypothetical protein n=1 Tax=Undibacterium sp. Ji50W TaxID=3413041 RepID=UPI003BF00B29
MTLVRIFFCALILQSGLSSSTHASQNEINHTETNREHKLIDGVVQRTVFLLENPRDQPVEPTNSVEMGEVVSIQKQEGDWMYVASPEKAGWLKSDNVILRSRFSVTKTWAAPQHITVGDGDYEAAYTFMKDGSFSVKETTLKGDSSYRLIKRKGKLFQFNNFLWAKVEDEPLGVIRIFLIGINGKLCWKMYMDGRCSIQ